MLAKIFEEQARRYAGYPAVVTDGQILTYDCLNRQANRVARAILAAAKKTLEEHEVIALLFEHGADMITGTVAAVKASKIYVPLDPNYPLDRLQYILENSGADTIVTNDRNSSLAKCLLEGMAAESQITVLNIDTFTAVGDAWSEENLNLDVADTRIAYLLYTSGSTGRPKGIVQTYANVKYFIDCYTKNLRLDGVPEWAVPEAAPVPGVRLDADPGVTLCGRLPVRALRAHVRVIRIAAAIP